MTTYQKRWASQRRPGRFWMTLAVGVAALVLGTHAPAQEGLPMGPPPAPDLTGRYAPLTCAPNGATCPFVVDDLKLTPVGQKMWDAYEEVIGPKFDCVPATPPSLLSDPYRWAIHQLTDRVILEYEKDDIVRTVWLTGWGHPEPGPYDASWQGHSIGWYEDNELVVITDRYLYDPTGLEDFGGRDPELVPVGVRELQRRAVEIEGVVTRFDFRNPHPILYVDVTNEDGEVEGWQIQFGNATGLRRRGWHKDIIQPGERISARGHPSWKPNTHGMQGASVIKEDGNTLGASTAD